MSPQQFLYKIWVPGHAPNAHEPTLTLHNATAIKFFVETVSRSTTSWTGQSFAVVAYYVVNELMERQVAEGTYQLQSEDGQIHVHELYKSGIAAPGTSSNIITYAFKAACKEQEQVL